MPLHSPNFIAGGNVSPARFVKITADNTVSQAGANDYAIGVSDEAVRRAPGSVWDDGYAAVQNDQIKVYGVGEMCLITLGGTVTAGQRVKSDASGQAVAALASGTTTQNVVGFVLVGGGSGDKVKMVVAPNAPLPPVA